MSKIKNYIIIDKDNNNKKYSFPNKTSDDIERINSDDNILTVINKLINYCYDKTNKKKIEYSSIYSYYINSDDDKIYPLSFIYEYNKEIDYKLTDNPDNNFINGGNRVDIPLNNKLSQILNDIPNIKENKIYFHSLPFFLEKYKSFNDIFYYSVIKKYWPFINFNPKTLDAYMKNINLSKNLNRIKNVTEIIDINNKQINIADSSEKIIDFGAIFSYKNIKLSTSITNDDDNNININKLFADIKLNNDNSHVIFSKLVLNNYKESYFKIYEPFIKNNKLTEKICDNWIQGNTEFIFGRIIREQIENVLILKLYINDKFYVSLDIWKEGIIEINIDNNDNILNNKDINDTISVCNKLLKPYKTFKIYGHIPIFSKNSVIRENLDVDNLSLNKNNEWNKYIKNINCILSYSKYDNDIIDTRVGTKGNTNIDINKLKNLLNNFSAYCRVIDDPENPTNITIRYKRVNNYVKIDNIENQIIILYNQIQKGGYNPKINEVKDKIIKKIQQDFELTKDDAKDKVNITFMEIERNENFRVDKNGFKIYTESSIDPGAEVIFKENDNKIIIEINNIKSIYEINNVIKFVEFIINFYTLYITDKINPEYKILLNKVESWVKKTDKYEEVSLKEIIPSVLKEDIPLIEDDDDSGSESSIGSIGGGGYIQMGGEGFMLKRLKSRDPSLFKWKAKDYDIEPWVKKCQPVDRHPIVLDDKELEHINNSENLGSGRKSYGNAESMGSDPDNKLNYICPKYWDVGKNISLDPNKMIPKSKNGERPIINDGNWYEGDIVSAKEGNSKLKSGIIQRDSIFWNDAKDVSDFFVEDTTKKIPPWQNPFGNPMPCCFNIKNIDIAKQGNKIDEVNDVLLEFLGETPTKYFLSNKIKKENYDFEKTAKDIGKNIKLLNEKIIVLYNEIIGDILEIKSLNKINKIIIKYNEILNKNNNLLDEVEDIKQNDDNKKSIKFIIKYTKLQNKNIDSEIKRLTQGENEIDLYDNFKIDSYEKYIKPGIISGFYKVRLENNSIMDCFLRISKYMQNMNNIKDSLDQKNLEQLFQISENYDINEQVENIKQNENIDEQKQKLIEILINLIDEPEIAETVKSKTRQDITNIKNLNTLYDSDIVFKTDDLNKLESEISDYYKLNEKQLLNIIEPPQKEFNKVIKKNIDNGNLLNLKTLDKNQYLIKNELEKNFIEKILKNYMLTNSKIEIPENDMNDFKSLLDKPKIWDTEKLGNKKYWGSDYSKIQKLLIKYTDILKLSKENNYLECNNVFNELFNENKIINRKISTLINSYIYDLYMSGYKKYFIGKIRNNPLDFLRASSGDILNSFYDNETSEDDDAKSLYSKIHNATDNYEKYIMNENQHNDLYVIPVIKTILPEFADTNIIIFDSNSSIGEQIKIPFDYFKDFDNKKYVLIVKNGNTYEPLFYRYIEDTSLDLDSSDILLKKKTLTEKAIINNTVAEKRQAILNMNTSNNFLKSSLTNIYSELKVIYEMNNSIPKNILSYDKISKLDGLNIDKYFVNIDNKVSHIITDENMIIPIYPIGLMKTKIDGEIIDESNIIYDYKKLPIMDFHKILSFYDKLNLKTINKFNYKFNYKFDGDKTNIIVDGDNAVNLLFENNTYIPINIKTNKIDKNNISGYINLFELDYNLANNIQTKDSEYINTSKLFEYEHKIYYIYQDTLLVYLLKNKKYKSEIIALIEENSNNINDKNMNLLINKKLYDLFEKINDELFKFTDDINIDDIDNINCNELTGNCKDYSNCILIEGKCLLKIKKTCFNSPDSYMKDKFIYKFIQSIMKYGYPQLIYNIANYINIPISEFKNTIKKDEIYYDYSIYLKDKLNLIFNEDNKYYTYLNLYGDNLPESN